jgi:hypothetical protein
MPRDARDWLISKGPNEPAQYPSLTRCLGDANVPAIPGFIVTLTSPWEPPRKARVRTTDTTLLGSAFSLFETTTPYDLLVVIGLLDATRVGPHAACGTQKIASINVDGG